MPVRQSPVIRFGAFEANLTARELRKNGVRLKLLRIPGQGDHDSGMKMIRIPG